MIKVYPKFELQTKYIFKDSNGQRQTLHPAETMADVEKTPQEFDGEDPRVAAKILEQLEAKTVKVSKDDIKILEATVKNVAKGAKDSDSKGKAPAKNEITEAVETAKREERIQATAIANNANKEIMDALKTEHKVAMDALKTQVDELNTQLDEATRPIE